MPLSEKDVKDTVRGMVSVYVNRNKEQSPKEILMGMFALGDTEVEALANPKETLIDRLAEYWGKAGLDRWVRSYYDEHGKLPDYSDEKGIPCMT